MPERAMHSFSGFPEGTVQMTNLPDQVFVELIPKIDDLIELKVTLLVLRRLTQLRSSAAPWVTRSELLADQVVQSALGADLEMALDAALVRAVDRGTLLVMDWLRADDTIERRYFANSPQGRMAVSALERGVDPGRASVPSQRPNIFTLYEQNIGPLTPLISEELMEAEDDYPVTWVEEAFRIAVERNVRNWKYIHTILERWRTEGKDEIDRRDRETDPKRFFEGEYSEFIQH